VTSARAGHRHWIPAWRDGAPPAGEKKSRSRVGGDNWGSSVGLQFSAGRSNSAAFDRQHLSKFRCQFLRTLVRAEIKKSLRLLHMVYVRARIRVLSRVLGRPSRRSAKQRNASLDPPGVRLSASDRGLARGDPGRDLGRGKTSCFRTVSKASGTWSGPILMNS